MHKKTRKRFTSKFLMIGKEFINSKLLSKIKEAEFPRAAQRPGSKTIDKSLASNADNIPQTNTNVKANILATKYSMEENENESLLSKSNLFFSNI